MSVVVSARCRLRGLRLCRGLHTTLSFLSRTSLAVCASPNLASARAPISFSHVLSPWMVIFLAIPCVDMLESQGPMIVQMSRGEIKRDRNGRVKKTL